MNRFAFIVLLLFFFCLLALFLFLFYSSSVPPKIIVATESPSTKIAAPTTVSPSPTLNSPNILSVVDLSQLHQSSFSSNLPKISSLSSFHFSAFSISEAIKNNLFKNFIRGRFAFNPQSRSFSSHSTEFKSNSINSETSSLSSSEQSNFDFGWRPSSCLPHSTIKCSKMKSVGGPLSTLSPRFNFDKSGKSKLSSSSKFDGFCCGFADSGIWTKPFSPLAFDHLQRKAIDVSSLLFGRLVWEDKGVVPLISKNSKYSSSSSSASVVGKTSEIHDEMKKLLEKIGETADAQKLLEEFYTVLGRSIAKEKVTLEQSRLMMFAGLSRLKRVSVTVQLPSQNSSSTQRAIRIFITGNSFLRALVSSFGGIMRNQNRYFDRGSHQIIRYVFTNLGDYYSFLDNNSDFDERYKNNKNNKTATRKKQQHQNLPPIILRSDDEVVFFEVVYKFETGMHIKNHEYSKKSSELSALDFNLESPVLNLEDQRQRFGGKFSAIFMRNFVIHSSSVFFNFFKKTGFEEYAKFQMETVMKNDVEPEILDDDESDLEKNYFIALHASPPIQYLWTDRNPSGVYAKYENVHGKNAFEAARDLQSTTTTTTTKARYAFIPYPKPNERFSQTDDLAHTNCILLPHFDLDAKGFRHNQNKKDDDDEEEEEQKEQQEKFSFQMPKKSNVDNIVINDCSDLLSRNYLFKFAFGMLMSAESTKKQFKKK
jgi:hypothetical protein